jgi:hypothetical protein
VIARNWKDDFGFAWPTPRGGAHVIEARGRQFLYGGTAGAGDQRLSVGALRAGEMGEIGNGALWRLDFVARMNSDVGRSPDELVETPEDPRWMALAEITPRMAEGWRSDGYASHALDDDPYDDRSPDGVAGAGSGGLGPVLGATGWRPSGSGPGPRAGAVSWAAGSSSLLYSGWSEAGRDTAGSMWSDADMRAAATADLKLGKPRSVRLTEKRWAHSDIKADLGWQRQWLWVFVGEVRRALALPASPSRCPPQLSV